MVQNMALICIFFVAATVQHAGTSSSVEPAGNNSVSPLFIKLHKVGSTTISSLFECSSLFEKSDAHALIRQCIGKKHPLRKSSMYSGIWDHQAMQHLVRKGSSALLGSPCFHLLNPGQKSDNLTGWVQSIKLPDVKAIVLLRHPVSRFMSFARFFYTNAFGRGQINQYDADLVHKFTTQRTNRTVATALHVIQLVRGRFAQDRNLVRVDQYSRIFDQTGFLNEPGGTAPGLSLSNFVVGITERMADTKLLLAVELKIPADDLCEPVEVMRANGGEKSASSFFDNEATRSALLSALSKEVAVYDLALRIHEGQLQRRGPEIEEMRAALEANAGGCAARRSKVSSEIGPLLNNPHIRDIDIVRACATFRADKPS